MPRRERPSFSLLKAYKKQQLKRQELQKRNYYLLSRRR